MQISGDVQAGKTNAAPGSPIHHHRSGLCPGFLSASKAVGILRVWAVALLLSGLLVAAGRRWPVALTPTPAIVWALLLLPPLLMGVWIARRWGRIQQPDPSEALSE